MMTVQLGSADWGQNPTGNTDKWYIQHYSTDGNYIHPDNYYWDEPRVGLPALRHYEDNFSPNTNDYYSDTEWVSGPNGVPDQFDFLIRTIKRWREYGVRRVLLHLPAGVIGGKISGYASGHLNDPDYAIYGGTMQSMNQFRGMPQWKQDYFKGQPLDMQTGFGEINGWANFLAEHPSPQDPNHIDIEIYIGGGVGLNSTGLGTDRTDVSGVGVQKIQSFDRFVGTPPNQIAEYKDFWATAYSNDTPPYPIDPRYLANGQYMKRNLSLVWYFIGPWITDCSIKRLWLDAASENTPSTARRWGSLELAHNPYLTSQGVAVRIGGETIPTVDVSPSLEILDDCAVEKMPWFANFQAMSEPINGNENNRAWKTYGQTSLSRSSTEVHVLDGNEQMEWHHYKYAREHGYVVGAYNAYGTNPKAAEMMKRWYNMGKIQVADFNGDGSVTEQDRIDAEAVIAQNTGVASVWPRVFGNGDINDDGVIDINDYVEYHLYWDNVANRTLKCDYGIPRESDL